MCCEGTARAILDADFRQRNGQRVVVVVHWYDRQRLQLALVLGLVHAAEENGPGGCGQRVEEQAVRRGGCDSAGGQRVGQIAVDLVGVSGRVGRNVVADAGNSNCLC